MFLCVIAFVNFIVSLFSGNRTFQTIAWNSLSVPLFSMVFVTIVFNYIRILRNGNIGNLMFAAGSVLFLIARTLSIIHSWGSGSSG